MPFFHFRFGIIKIFEENYFNNKKKFYRKLLNFSSIFKNKSFKVLYEITKFSKNFSENIFNLYWHSFIKKIIYKFF